MNIKLILLLLIIVQIKLYAITEKDIKVYLVGIKEDNVYGLPVVSCLERNNYRIYYQIESVKIDKQLIVNINNILKKSYYMLNISPSRNLYGGYRYPFADFEIIDYSSNVPPCEGYDSLIKIDNIHYMFQGMPYYLPSSFPIIDSLVNASKTNCFYKSKPLSFNQWELIWKDNPLIQNAYFQQNYDIYDTSNADKFKHLISIVNDSVLFLSAKEIMLINLKTGKPIHFLQELQQSKIKDYYSYIVNKLFSNYVPGQGERTFNHIDLFPKFVIGYKYNTELGKFSNDKWEGYLYYLSDRMDLYNKKYFTYMHDLCIEQIAFSELKKFLNPKSVYFNVIKIYTLSKQKP
jgi:hypothetical protein